MTTNAQQFVITKSGGWVAGFKANMGIVQLADTLEYAKKFKTEAAAQAWGRKHQDCGYGLGSGTWTVVSV